MRGGRPPVLSLRLPLSRAESAELPYRKTWGFHPLMDHGQALLTSPLKMVCQRDGALISKNVMIRLCARQSVFGLRPITVFRQKA